MKELSQTNKMLSLVAFAEGMLVMTWQLIGGMLLAQQYGNSLVIWSTVIGVVMFSLACGYYFGGILSNRKKAGDILFGIIIVQVILISLSKVYFSYIFTQLIDFSLYSSALIAGVLLLFVPNILSGIMGPLTIQLRTKEIEKGGENTGNFYGISSIGGVLVCLFYGFYIIPEFGNYFAIALTAIVTSMLAAYMLFLKGKKMTSVIVFVGLFILSLAPLKERIVLLQSKINIVYETDGLSGNLKVLDNTQQKTRTLLVDNVPQTKMHITGRSLWPYVYQVVSYVSYKPKGSKVLLAGIGGGNLVNELSYLGFEVYGVDIDPRLPELAWNYFGMNTIAKMHVDDARHYLNVDDKKYDIVIFDLSSAEKAPSNLFTLECFSLVKERLNPGGIFLLHYVSSLDEENIQGIASIGKTFLASGYNVHLMNTNPLLNVSKGFIYFAQLDEMILNEQNFRIDAEILANLEIPLNQDIFYEGINFENGIILTDDQPILDVLHQYSVKKLRLSSRKSYSNILLQLKK